MTFPQNNSLKKRGRTGPGHCWTSIEHKTLFVPLHYWPHALQEKACPRICTLKFKMFSTKIFGSKVVK